MVNVVCICLLDPMACFSVVALRSIQLYVTLLSQPLCYSLVSLHIVNISGYPIANYSILG